MSAQHQPNAAMNETASPSTSAIESEVKTKWCPFSREAMKFPDGCISANRISGKPSPGSLCLGSACIAWDKDEGCLMIRLSVFSSTAIRNRGCKNA